MGNQAQQSFSDLLQPYSEEFFQKSVIDPSLKSYREQILPELRQQFVSADAGSSSALNQALSKSATDLASNLADKRLGLRQFTAQSQLGGLGQLGALQQQRTFEPLVQGPQQGILGDIIKALGYVAGSYASKL